MNNFRYLISIDNHSIGLPPNHPWDDPPSRHRSVVCTPQKDGQKTQLDSWKSWEKHEKNMGKT